MSESLLPPIAAPAVIPGSESPRFLLHEGRAGDDWMIGFWDGAEWCDDDGAIVEPVHFAELPPPPASA